MSVYRPKYRDHKTGELKEQRIWWYRFNFAGRRIQESSKSPKKTMAIEAQRKRRDEFENSFNRIPVQDRRKLIRPLSEVLQDYAQQYAVNHRKKSLAVVEERSAHLERILGRLMVSDITAERVVEYMAERLAEKKRGRPPSGRTINLEIQILASSIGSTRTIGDTWRTLWPRVKKLPENHDVGRAITPEEEAAVLEAASRNRSRLIYPFLFTLAWTGLRSDEARTLQWRQVNFADAGEITVLDSKTEAGKRQIPMSANLKAVLDQHAAWYVSKFGPLQPDWYVFPKTNTLAPIDPLCPVTSLKTAWNSVRDTAKVTCRLHDLRHSFCTKMAEAGIPESTMLDMMGHVSPVMLKRYSHIRAKARREAMDTLESLQAGKVLAKVSQSESEKRSANQGKVS